MLKDGLMLNVSYDQYCGINTPDPYKKPYKPVINILKEAYSAVVENRNTDSARYVARIADKFVVFSRNGNVIERDIYPNIFSLLATLTLKPKKKMKYTFCSTDPVFAVLNAVLEFSKRHSITIAYEERGEFVIIYVINEMGNLFCFFKPKNQREELLTIIYDFRRNTVKRVKQVDVFSEIDKGEICVQYFKTDRFGNVTVTDDTNQIRGKSLLKHDMKVSLTATVIKHKDKVPHYKIEFPDRSATDFVSLQQLGGVSMKVLEFLKNGIKVKGVISDIIFSDLKKEEGELGSTLYFLEKYRIESILERGMKKG